MAVPGEQWCPAWGQYTMNGPGVLPVSSSRIWYSIANVYFLLYLLFYSLILLLYFSFTNKGK